MPVRELPTEFFSNSITTITQIVDQFTDNNPDYERSSKARRGVLEMIPWYQELLRDRKLQKRQ
jgi:hypothetical protein